MPARRLLYLTDQQMTAYLWRAGEFVNEGSFTASEDGHRDFASFLRRHDKSVFAILANVAGESFHVETIPFLRGAERHSVITRKLAQLFSSKPMSAAASLGYERSQRKDERLLFAALNDAQTFNPWLAAIDNAGVALAGIFSLPLLSGALLKRLGVGKAPCLLLSVQDTTVRQSYLAAGELRFSRLAPLHDASDAGIAHAFASETRKLREYLASQRLVARNETIATFLIAHSSVLPALQETCIDNETTHYQAIGIEGCARAAGLRTAQLTSHCEHVFLRLVVTGAPSLQFADARRRHVYQLARVRAAMLSASALVLAACLLWAAHLQVETTALAETNAALTAEASAARQRHAQIVGEFPPLPLPTDALRRIVDRYHEFERAAPDRLFQALSVGLDAVPQAQVDSVAWSARVRAGGPGGEAKAAAEHIVVRGTIDTDAEATPRQTLDVFSRLLAALATVAKIDVEVLKRPFDIEAGKSLKGSDAGVEASAPRSFALRIAQRSEP